MGMYILPIFKVVPGAPRAEYESEGKAESFRNQADAEYYASWWAVDQGRKDTVIVNGYAECPVINGVVYVPPSIN